MLLEVLAESQRLICIIVNDRKLIVMPQKYYYCEAQFFTFFLLLFNETLLMRLRLSNRFSNVD